MLLHAKKFIISPPQGGFEPVLMKKENLTQGRLELGTSGVQNKSSITELWRILTNQGKI